MNADDGARATAAAEVRGTSLRDLAARIEPAVVHVVVELAGGSGNGSGFFVDGRGVVLTNHHVIADARHVTVKLSNGKELVATGLVADDPAADLALLKVPGTGHPSLTLSDSALLAKGDEIVVLGSPLGLSWTLSRGVVSAIRTKEETEEQGRPESWLVQIDAAISPGSSGSPVMTLDGKVVGIAVGLRRSGQNLNFAVPANQARRLIQGADMEAPPKPFGLPADDGSLYWNLGISAAAFLVVGLLAVYGGRLVQRKAARGR